MKKLISLLALAVITMVLSTTVTAEKPVVVDAPFTPAVLTSTVSNPDPISILTGQINLIPAAPKSCTRTNDCKETKWQSSICPKDGNGNLIGQECCGAIDKECHCYLPEDLNRQACLPD